MENKNNKPIIVLLILSIGLNIYGLYNTRQLRSDLNNNQNSINNLEMRLNSSIYNLQNNIQETLKKSSSIVSDFTYDIVGYKDKKVDMILKVNPNSISINDKFYFNLESSDGISKIIEANTNDSVNFTATLNMSIYDTMEIDLIVDDGVTKKTEKLTTIYPPEQMLINGVNAFTSGGSWSHNSINKFLEYNSEYNLEFLNEDKTIRKINDVNISIVKNDIIIDNFPMKEITNNYGPELFIFNFELKDYKINIDPNDKIEINATAQDSRGFTYKVILESLTINSKNEIAPNYSHQPNMVTIE